jgi:dihydroorotate dehydrogenase
MKTENELTVEQLEERVEFTVAAIAGGEISQAASSVEPIKCGARIVGSCSGLVAPASIDPASIDVTSFSASEVQAYQSLLR